MTRYDFKCYFLFCFLAQVWLITHLCFLHVCAGQVKYIIACLCVALHVSNDIMQVNLEKATERNLLMILAL